MVLVLRLQKPQLSPNVDGLDVVVVFCVLYHWRCPRELVAFLATVSEFYWQQEAPLSLVFPGIIVLLLRMYPFKIGDIMSDDATKTTIQVN